MAFGSGRFAAVWSIEPHEKSSSVRISTSKKNMQTGMYETDFSGFVTFIGDAHDKIRKYPSHPTKPKTPIVKIRLDDATCTRPYPPPEDKDVVKFQVYDFTPADQVQYEPAPEAAVRKTAEPKRETNFVDVPEDSDEELPFN